MYKIIYFLVLVVLLNKSFAQDKNAVGSVGPVKFSGLMFGDLFYNADAINQANKDVNGFNFRRIYFTADYTINEQFSSRFRMESSISNGSNIGVFVKDASLKWKDVFKGSDLIVGMSPTPAFDVSEGVWGYRSLEKTTLDYFGIVSSRDIGIDLKGKFDEDGVVKYWLKLGNGSGNKPETDKYNRYYAHLQFNPGSNFVVTVYGDYNSMPQILDTYDNELKNNSAFVFAGFIGYQNKKDFAIGLEAFLKNQQNNYSVSETEPLENQSGLGISVWARALLSEKIGLVGRFDTFDPNTDSAIKNDVRQLILGAVDFKVAPNVSVMPGIEIQTLENADNSDVTPRITFFWEF